LPYRILGWHPIGQIEFSAGFRINPVRDERIFSKEESLMYKVIPKNRLLAFNDQHGRCYYCGAPMWIEKKGEFSAKYRVSKKLAKRLRCTAEHLIARQDGGTDDRENIVAACYFCNSTRHHHPLNALSPVKYRKKVLQCLRSQKWHPKECLHML
jgi:hypothetical protein